ncbi:MAG: PH domain-containing protein [Candidatus Binatia bacterium]|jgi:uncharacterized membrane protein YdbT with pleckstrin-like domain
MGYIDANLLRDETLIYRARLHWIVFVWPALVLVICYAVALALLLSRAVHEVTLAAIFIAVGSIPIARSLIAYATSEFGVTNKRVLVKIGFIRRNSLEILLNKVESIQIDQGVLGRLLDYGSIVVSGTGGSRDPFHNLSSPLRFRRAAQEQIAVVQDPGAKS